MIKNIFILVGGRGTRLGNLTKKTPKPLLTFNKNPFLNYLLESLVILKPKIIYLLCCYKSKLFFEKYHNKKILKSKIICIKENQPLGTGGSLNNIKKYINGNSLVLNGDTFFNYNFKNLNTKIKKKYLIKIFCIKNVNYKSNKKLNNLEIKNGLLYFKKNSKLMNSGIYLFNKKFSNYLNKKKCSIEDDILPNLINQKKITAEKIKCFSIDIGTIKNYYKFKSLSKNLKPSLF